MARFNPSQAVACLALVASALSTTFGAINWNNVVPGNVSTITTDIPSTWWQVGTTPNLLVNGDVTDRWLTGNYDPTWPGSPVTPPGPNGSQTLFPYTVTLTFTAPQSVSKVREMYTQDGGSFDQVTVTALNSSLVPIATSNVIAKKSAADWNYHFGQRLTDVKQLVFNVAAHGMPSYFDVRAGEILAFDDDGSFNIAPSATITGTNTGAPAYTVASDGDTGSLWYSGNSDAAGNLNTLTTLVYNFGVVKPVNAFRLYLQNFPSTLRDYQIQIPDGVGGWTDIFAVTGNTSLVRTDALASTVFTDQIRLLMTRINNGTGPDPRARILEFEILNPEPSSMLLLSAAAFGLMRRRPKKQG